MSENQIINLTERASQEINIAMKENNLNQNKSFLRVGVKGGGCSGFQYILDITEEKKKKDIEIEQHGIKIIVDDKSSLYLRGTKIDFKDELTARGFVFENPQATSTCGCNQSFSA